MGTRNLTMVIHNEETKIAQYGQWDGYPRGNGKKILNFLRNVDYEKFKKQLTKVRFATEKDDKEVDEYLKSIGCKDGWMNLDQANLYHKQFPYLSRDIGAGILELVYNSKRKEKEIVLQDETNFAGDSVFCEWAYVIDLDNNKLEVYTGFNKRPLGKTQRFKDLEGNDEFSAIRCVKKYDLFNLPMDDKFFTDLKDRNNKEE